MTWCMQSRAATKALTCTHPPANALTCIHPHPKMHLCIPTHTHMPKHPHKCTQMHAYTHIDTHTHTPNCICTHQYKCTQRHTHIHRRMHTQTHMQVLTYTCKCTHIHAHALIQLYLQYLCSKIDLEHCQALLRTRKSGCCATLGHHSDEVCMLGMSSAEQSENQPDTRTQVRTKESLMKSKEKQQ